MLKEQTVIYKIKVAKSPNTDIEAVATDLLKELKTYIFKLRSDITDGVVLEAKDKYVLIKLDLTARRNLRCGQPETDEEREESIKALISQIVLTHRRDCLSIDTVRSL